MAEEAPAKAPFVLDEWKRVYSNEEVTVSIPWFFENFDKETHSIWFAKYKYELDQPMKFMCMNLVGGMFQRLERCIKIGFASVLIFGASKPFEIEGV